MKTAAASAFACATASTSALRATSASAAGAAAWNRPSASRLTSVLAVAALAALSSALWLWAAGGKADGLPASVSQVVVPASSTMPFAASPQSLA